MYECMCAYIFQRIKLNIYMLEGYQKYFVVNNNFLVYLKGTKQNTYNKTMLYVMLTLSNAVKFCQKQIVKLQLKNSKYFRRQIINLYLCTIHK